MTTCEYACCQTLPRCEGAGPQTNAAVIAKFDAFFQVRKNIIFERAMFNRRNRQAQEGESVKQFITSFYSLAESSDY